MSIGAADSLQTLPGVGWREGLKETKMIKTEVNTTKALNNETMGPCLGPGMHGMHEKLKTLDPAPYMHPKLLFPFMANQSIHGVSKLLSLSV